MYILILVLILVLILCISETEPPAYDKQQQRLTQIKQKAKYQRDHGLPPTKDVRDYLMGKYR